MRIEVLYPEICNLYGDLANIRYIKQSAEDVRIIETHLHDEPLFVREKPDMVYIGTTTERGQQLAINALRPYYDSFVKAVDEGVNFLVTGNAVEIWAKEIYEDGVKVCDGLGYIDITARRESRKRYNSLYVGNMATDDGSLLKIVGFKTTFGFIYGEGLRQKLFDTEIGYGSNRETSDEGIRINNFMATYITGPLMVLNPLFTEWYMKKQLGIENVKAAYREAAIDAYETRLKEYTEPGRGWEY